ncbi:uncharacterized protein M421DRAFT_92650 [Didymella exigua CBS 183.55]|uniref:Uncharacterized protein n=1 Tax=Didymella exigua CBS 183.55 TaxID=1150837 RepID=A0A6A5RJ43_9PLEO|nr:uncharacterized protein M421DRAFT_92650 [Didymella exigua CBS 183.55]KAF1928401.1 hypothetical protein M421DRAFT_92650 [Didymella exigua CBS 183.55]
MAANADDGAICFIDRRSAVSGAAGAWGVSNPPVDELPKLRQMSHTARGIWRRVRPDGEGLGNLKYFIVSQVVNAETEHLIADALKTYRLQARQTELSEWPGVTWAVETQEGAAMLGSPNGLAIGYFLSQHKAQLGGNKYVHQVQVYTENEGGDPYMVFHVKDAPPAILKAGLRGGNGQAQPHSGQTIVIKRCSFTFTVLHTRDIERNALPVVPSLPQQYTTTNSTTLTKIFGASPTVTSDAGRTQLAPRADSPPPAKRPEPNSNSPAESHSEWDKHVCRGEKLTRASKLDKDKAEAFALPISTKWSGNLETERKLWGYFDSPDPDCDLEGSYYDITNALEALGVEKSECFRTQHYDSEGEISIKDQTYKVGEKEYRATGAHGTFAINVEEGAVFLIDVASAPRKAAQLWGVDAAAKDQLPELIQISDIAWGFWHQAHGGSDLGHITKFVVPQIINDITIRLINQALETYNVPDGEERHNTVPEWPGISFKIDTPAGKALLGSPIGIPTAYFLSQHKSEIGKNKYVSRVTVFRPDEDTGSDEPSIIYYVEDAPAPSQGDQNPDQDPEKNSEHTEGHIRRDLVLTTDDLVSTTKKDSWHDCVCRGEKLTQACKADTDKAAQIVTPINTPWKGSMVAELAKWGYREQPAMSHCNFEDIGDALNALKISTLSEPEGGLNSCYKVRHSYEDDYRDLDGGVISEEDQTYTVEEKTYRMTDAHAIIGANTLSGVIFFVDFRSASHAAGSLWYPEIPTAETLPKLRAISDISWAFWNRAWEKRSGKNRDLGNINFFVVHNIVNEKTNQLIEKALQVYEPPEGQQRLTELPEWPGLILDVESEPGKALLGSPNGIAAGYFLAQHKAEIGANKYVYQVQIFESVRGFGPSMILHVKDALAPTADDTTPPVDRRRSNDLNGRGLITAINSSIAQSPPASNDVVSVIAKKRPDDDTLWNSCKCRGEKITQASLQNKVTATKLVNPIDSPWEGTMEAELTLWGYKQPKGLGLYCNLDNVAASLKEMGVDTKFKENTKSAQNECYQAHHSRGGPRGQIKEQTYVVGDKTYRIGVNARNGMITFFNVRSAAQSAMQIWGVDEVTADELPELNRVSDISWAFWKRAHKDDAGLNNIQKFFVHDAVNEDTLRLVGVALKTYQVPEGDIRRTRLPKWPGLVFDIETEEGKVMLGSPNGIAAGYFLVQHKTQLGCNKYIYQVTLWSDPDGDVQMMFWVKDAPPLQDRQEERDDRKRSTQDEDNGAHAFGKTGRVVKRSQDGRKAIREHWILAML